MVLLLCVNFAIFSFSGTLALMFCMWNHRRGVCLSLSNLWNSEEVLSGIF